MILQRWQDQLNETIKPALCEKYRLRPDSFRIELAPRLKFSVAITPGTMVLIRLGIMPNEEGFIDVLKRAVKRVPEMLMPMAVERYAMVERRNDNLKKLMRKSFDEEADLIVDLLTSNRVQYKIVTKVTAKDVVTGLEVSVEDGSALQNELKIAALNMLSVAVMGKEMQDE